MSRYWLGSLASREREYTSHAILVKKLLNVIQVPTRGNY
jgi:hypothetical protein